MPLTPDRLELELHICVSHGGTYYPRQAPSRRENSDEGTVWAWQLRPWTAMLLASRVRRSGPVRARNRVVNKQGAI